jgi:hypothetical protein
MNTPKYIAVVALVLALSLPAAPVSAAPSASLILISPIPNPGQIGGDVIFELAIGVTDIDPGVAGAEIYLGYDGPVAPPVSPLGVAIALPDFFGVSDVSIKEILQPCQFPGGSSANPCVHLVVAGPPQKNHSGAAARFHFRCMAEGTAHFIVLASTLVDADGFQVAHAAASPTSVSCIFRATLTGKVLRQGMLSNALACSAVWSTSGGTTFGPVFTNVSGDFVLPDLPSGTHMLHAQYPGYLASEKTIPINISNTTTIPVGTTTLRGGDANLDNKINILDIGEVISEFGRTGAPVGSSNLANCMNAASVDEPADINDDGNVNISDLAIAAGNWGLTGPTNWP